ncbi:MAG: alpha-galactosidase [Armatimonadota bacterium]
MANLDYCNQWVAAAFMGDTIGSVPLLVIGHEDGVGETKANAGAAGGPLRINGVTYKRGIGVNSHSELHLTLPEGAARLQAVIGLDDNVRGTVASVQFHVHVDGNERLRTSVMKSPSVPLSLDIPVSSAKEVLLTVSDGGDGRSFDQAIWADARIIMTDGSVIWLDDLLEQFAPEQVLPFEFTLGDVSSRDILARSERSVSPMTSIGNGQRQTITFRNVKTGLEISCQLTQYQSNQAAEWVLRFANTGSTDLPVLSAVHPLHMQMRYSGTPELHWCKGGMAEADDYHPYSVKMLPDQKKTLAPNGGRSSNCVLPMFNLQMGSGGVFAAVGWSGQWHAEVRRVQNDTVQLQAGQQDCRIALRPGESFRTPSVLVMFWQDADRYRAHNRFRRLLAECIMPAPIKTKSPVPAQVNTWFPVGDDGGKATEQNQLDIAKSYQSMGIDTLVIDAGWYGGPDWVSSVGDWSVRKDSFPRGLGPVSRQLKQQNMGLGLWLEPERAFAGSKLEREHPEWMVTLGDSPHRMVNLGLADVQQWFIDLVSSLIEENGLSYFRHDFNFDPLPYWQKMDKPGREGLTEIRYIEGLYRVLDELRSKYPQVLFEGCASGGRRIDIETMRRNHLYWKSDLYGEVTSNQNHVSGMNLFLPGGFLNTPLLALDEEPYALRSQFSGALCLGWDARQPQQGPYPKSGFRADWAKRTMAECAQLSEYAKADFYPLTTYHTEEDQWVAWQFHRPETGDGIVICLRRPESQIVSLELSLHQMKPKQRYELKVEGQRTSTVTGEQMEALRLSIETRPGSLLCRYRELR